MAEKHKRDAHGRLQDGVRSNPLTSSERMAYGKAAREVGDLSVPRMFDSSNPHARLYFANFDGTGNDLWADPEHATNVAKLHLQLRQTSARDDRIWTDYIKGAGTQEDVIARTIDGATGGSYDDRIEEMYLKFISKAKAWIEVDPNADIRLMPAGFSRGGEQAAGFARLVHERGIQDPLGRKVVHHSFGPDTFEWTLPPLRAPGKTLMSEILFDPVGTGVPNNHDRQPTSAVVSGIQITAKDERRNAFPSTQILPPGLSADGRFVGITVPGAHSDIGGSYHRNGIAVFNFNIAVAFLNAHSDVALAHRMLVPTDPAMFEIHRSDEHKWFYSTSEFTRDGQRDIMGSQASPPHCRDERKVFVCAPPDPFDPELNSVVGQRYPVGVYGPDAIQDMRDASHPDHGMYHSASVQVLELYARSGFGLDSEQVDRLTAGLVIEAKRKGMASIDDVRFGKDAGPGRPMLHAFEDISGDIADSRSRGVSVETLNVLGVPMDASNQQLHALNQERAQHVGREAVSVHEDKTPGIDPVTPGAVRTPPAAAPSQSDAFERADADATRALQKDLNTLGVRDMSGEPLVMNGVYDVATRTAVARFQSGHTLPVTGQADDATRSMIQGKAFIADLQQASDVRIATDVRHFEASPAVPSITAYEAPVHIGMSRSPMPPRVVHQSRSDPRSPESPDHGLYNELQGYMPEASEDRLLQFTAACHRHGITAGNVSEVHQDADRKTLSIDSDDLMSTPVVIDLSRPPPEPEQSIRQIQQFDQQMDQIAQQSQDRSAQMAQQGPVM